MIETRELKEALLSSDFLAFLEDLLPNGRVEGSNYCVADIGGDNGRSLKVKVYGENKGVYADFAGEARGDCIDLVMQVKQIGFREALQYLQDYLGIKDKKHTFVRTSHKTYTEPSFKEEKPQDEVINYFRKRGLKDETTSAYKISSTHLHFGVTEGTAIVFPFYSPDNRITLLKYLRDERPEGKRHILASANSRPILFGWQCIPKSTRKLVITKGEVEVMSLHQLGVPALSVTFGEGKGHAWTEHEYENLLPYEEIILHADDDKPGHDMVEELAIKLGRHRCRAIYGSPIEGLKDINDALIAGVSPEELAAWLDTAVDLNPEQLKQASEFETDVLDLFYSTDPKKIGIPFPLPSMGDKFKIRRKEVTIWTGFNGHGKSQMLGQTVLHLSEQGEKCLIASFEMTAATVIGRLLRQKYKTNLPSTDQIREGLEWMKDKIIFYDYVGSANKDDLLSIFKYAAKKYSCTQFVVDSLMKCGVNDEDLSAQKEFVDAFQNFSREYDSHTHIVAHSRKKENENTPPGKMDVRGAGAITDLVENLICVWRNKDKEKDLRTMLNSTEFSKESIELFKLQYPDAIIQVSKQRNGSGEEPEGRAYFDPASQYFTDMDAPRSFV